MFPELAGQLPGNAFGDFCISFTAGCFLCATGTTVDVSSSTGWVLSHRSLPVQRNCGALGEPTYQSPEGGGTINMGVLPGKLQ